MSIKPKIRPEISASPQMHVLGAHFAIGQICIPYVTAHMRMSDAAHYLKTPEQLPGWADGPTEIEALYQRQLDYKRVKNGILPYLSNTHSEQPRFFNAITVALFPYSNHKIRQFSDDGLKAPQLESTGTTHYVSTGPIKFGFYQEFEPEKPESMSIGEMRWNLEETAAVALDGQHRLAACQLLYQADQEQARNTKVCVIFVLPSPELGYNGPTGSRKDLLRLLRSIFIDLNKHARPVKRSRLILLDDGDPHSHAVRQLIERRLRSINVEDVDEAEHLPLTLVDWHTDDAKFESGPYITTVLMLDRIVQILLGGVKPVTDWTDRGAVERQFEAFRKLGFSPTEECQYRYEQFRDADELSPLTLSYPKEDLERIEAAVNNSFASAVKRLLTEITPYRKVINIRSEYRMLSTDFSNWYEAFAAEDGTPQSQHRLSVIEDHIQHKDNPPKIKDWRHCLTTEIPKIKDESLFFKVVFQAALFRALNDLWRTSVVVLEEGEVPPRGSPANLALWTDQTISTINRLLESNGEIFHLKAIFSVDDRGGAFWAGSVLNLDKNAIDFTNAGVQRASHWLKLIVQLDHAANRWREVFGEAIGKDFEDGLARLYNEDPDYTESVRQGMKRLTVGNTANRGAMWRYVKAIHDIQDEEESADWITAEAENELHRRLRYLWRLLEE